MFRNLIVAVALTACASAPPAPTAPPPHHIGDTWHHDALAIAAGDDVRARGTAIEARLSAAGIPFQRQVLPGPGREIVNIVAAPPDTRDLPVLLIGAHYDRVDAGRGAVDNASGCAAVLELGAALADAPLAHHRVMLAFWDLEEVGLEGSKAFLAATPPETELYLNFDVFGYGDTLWGMVPNAEAGFGAAMRAAGVAANLPTDLGETYPPSDHLAFLKVGRRAVSLSLVGGDEIPGILAAFRGAMPDPLPRTMRVLHSVHDVPAELEPERVTRALKVVLDGLRRWDASASGEHVGL